MAGVSITLKKNQWTNIQTSFSPALAAGTAVTISLGSPPTDGLYKSVVTIREEATAPTDFEGAHASLNISQPKSTPGGTEFTFMAARDQDEIVVYAQESA